jgi:nitroreductase
MSGILFLKTGRLAEVVDFYTSRIGADVWLDQKDCVVLRHGNFLFGFCERDTVEAAAMLTFFYNSRAEVDHLFGQLEEIALDPPAHNAKYNIYQFFARDPEGRIVEIQYFEDAVRCHLSADDLLRTRRSVREFLPNDVSDELIGKVVELSRWAPTARNTQPYYFKIIRDHARISWLARARGSNTAPIGRAPVAVAVCSDPAVSSWHVQDGCIAAYHFMMAAWHYGLGTCWIADMDREDIRDQIQVPPDHCVVTVTPLGVPSERVIEPPERKQADTFVKNVK